MNAIRPIDISTNENVYLPRKKDRQPAEKEK